MTDEKDKNIDNINIDKKDKEVNNNNDPEFSFEDLQKQLQRAMKNLNLGSNSFIMPIKTPTPTLTKENKNNIKADTDKKKVKEKNDPQEALKVIRNFALKPKQIKEYLDRFVIKQEEAKKVLSVAVCDHYNHIRKCMQKGNSNFGEYTKQNVLLLGPTGVGKTYLIKCLANLIGVPFVKADATKYSATGYVGHDVEDLVRDLVKIANGNTELAQCGIIYIDEIDKIATSTSEGGKDVSGRGVQINLLKLMEDSEVNLQSQTDMMGQFESVMDMMHGGGGKKKKKTINTRNILFIVSGSFDKMSGMIKKRIDGSMIGFGAEGIKEKPKSEYLVHSTTADFIKYGFEPEFVGRIPIRVTCRELLAEDLSRILIESEGSILRQYVEDFNGYDINLDVTAEAINEIAEKAHKQQTGARGLMTVMEKAFRSFKFELPSTDISNFKVTKDVVSNPQKELENMLSRTDKPLSKEVKQAIINYSKDFEDNHGFILDFNNAAAKAINELSKSTDKSIFEICNEKFKDYPYGLNLILDNLKNKKFNVTAAMVKNPDKALSDRIAKLVKKPS